MERRWGSVKKIYSVERSASMEKSAAKPKNGILKFLPKVASAVTFQSPPFSPGRDKRSDNATKLKPLCKGFSGPIISIIPAEARRKTKSGSFDTQEPTSPKVSCMGQIKHKQKICKSKRVAQAQQSKPVPAQKEVKRQLSTIRKIFGAKPGRKSNASADDEPPLPVRAPPLCQMKRFASGRDAFANFDWTAQVAPVELDRRNCYSDEERGGSEEEEEEEEEEIIIPFSAPILVGGRAALQPRKEVNLWKRRTMAPPRPLQLKTIAVRSH